MRWQDLHGPRLTFSHPVTLTGNEAIINDGREIPRPIEIGFK
jgi:hypothetical protein